MATADAAKESGRLVRRTSVNDRRASAVDETAIATLYQRRFHAFVGGAYAVLGDPEAARDAVQETFARALRERGRFQAEGTLEAWLWRIVVNVARDVARRSRFGDLSADELAELAVLGSDPHGLRDLRSELRELPERQRLAVFLPTSRICRTTRWHSCSPSRRERSPRRSTAARRTLRHRIEEAYE
jgi:hypothetical protein